MKIYLPICFVWFYLCLVLNKTTAGASRGDPFQTMFAAQPALPPDSAGGVGVRETRTGPEPTQAPNDNPRNGSTA
jgi:hypothetical protein